MPTGPTPGSTSSGWCRHSTAARSSRSAPRARSLKRLRPVARGRATAASRTSRAGYWCGSWVRDPPTATDERVRYHNRCRAIQPRKTVQVPCTPTTPTAKTRVIRRSLVVSLSLGRLAASLCATTGGGETYCMRIESCVGEMTGGETVRES